MFAFALDAGDADGADLGDVADVSAAAGLEVYAGDLQEADAAGAARWLDAHGFHQLGTGVHFFIGDPHGLGVDGAGDQGIRFLFDARGVEQAHIDVEVEPRFVWANVAAGDGRDDYARHHVQ